jgi:hypothetical protein
VKEPDGRKLLAFLSVAIASIMEDEVEPAILALPADDQACAERFESLQMAGRDIDVLAAAAAVVIRRGGTL